MSQARKLRRAAAAKPLVRDDETPPLGRVGMLAGISLGLSDEQSADALNALAGFRQGDGTSAAMFARMLELVDLARLDGAGDELGELDTAAERAKLERSFGVGFVKRVAAMGKPATSMLQALRGLLLLLVLTLWPSSASAATALASEAQNAHKIQRRNRRRRRLRRSVRIFADAADAPYHRARGWIRSSRKFGVSLPLFSSFPSFGIGSARERESCKSRASSSKSFWSGGVAASTSTACPRVTRTSRSCGETARWRARHTGNAGCSRKMTTPAGWCSP